MKPWFAMALTSALMAGCAATPPSGPANAADAAASPETSAVVVQQDPNGAPVQTVPRRAPRVGLGIGLGSWGGRGFGGLGIGLGF